MPAAIRSPLMRVRWTRLTRRPLWAWSSAISGAASAAAARGSLDSADTGSFATSSDCTPIRVGAPTGSTSYRIAAIDRWTNDTIRVERTRTA